MGKTKTAIIDDSVPQAEEKKGTKPERKKVLGINREEKTLGPSKPKVDQAPKKESSEAKEEKEKEQVQGKPKHSKKYLEVSEKIERSKNYKLDEAIALAKEISYSKFDGSLEIHINTNIKNVRGLVSLPFATGKSVKIIAFGKGAEESGAELIGDDKKLQEIEKGKVDFDVLVTTAEWMPRIARLAKVLGPKGLMPNPKNGTVTGDLKKTVVELQSGKVEYKTEKVGGVMHLSLGKLSQPNEELTQNVKGLLTAIGKSKLKKVIIAPTMGPGVRVDTSSI